MLERILRTNAPTATILIRSVVGLVFLSEGLQKFIFPDTLGVGRFISIGIPAPHFTAPFVGVVEITGGLLLVLGLLTRIAAFALVINMAVAIATTKIPILMHKGFWAMAHESRTDFSMLLGCLFLLIVGAGKSSIDAQMAIRPGSKRTGE